MRLKCVFVCAFCKEENTVRDFHLRFALSAIADLSGQSGWYDNEDYAIFNLVNGEIGDVPDEPGGYVLGTADCTMLVYPWGTSPVYYIGKAEKSTGLRGRLQEHAKLTQEFRDDHEEHSWPGNWRTRYQYGAAFGAHAVWYLAGDIKPLKIEEALMGSFYDIYGSIPVANGAQSKGQGE